MRENQMLSPNETRDSMHIILWKGAIKINGESRPEKVFEEIKKKL